MKAKKLLFVTRFEELWFDALQELMVLRKTGFNHFVFLHVIDRDKVAMHRGVGYLKEEEVKSAVEKMMKKFSDKKPRFFVQEFMPAGKELIIGANAEGDLGHLIMF